MKKVVAFLIIAVPPAAVLMWALLTEQFELLASLGGGIGFLVWMMACSKASDWMDE